MALPKEDRNNSALERDAADPIVLDWPTGYPKNRKPTALRTDVVRDLLKTSRV